MSGNSKFLLDTNIVLGFLSGQAKICDFLHQKLTEEVPCLSQITRMELLI